MAKHDTMGANHFSYVAFRTKGLIFEISSVPARVEPTARGFRLELDEPAYGVAAGQAAVLYDRDTVVGYGLITASH